jgi:hypothetical protein
MATSNNDCCFFGRGSLYMSKSTNGQSYGNNWGLCWGQACSTNAAGRFVGNVSSLELSINYENKQVLNLSERAFEPDCSVCIIDSVEFSMTMNCFSDANLKEALLGNVTETTPSAIPVTDHIALPTTDVPFECGTFIPFNEPGVDANSVVVTHTGTGATLLPGTDYEVDTCGITLLTSWIFGAGVGFNLAYSYSDVYRSIEPLTRDCENVRLQFKGKNIANGGAPFLATFYNVKISPASALQLISDSEFPTLEITGTLEPDKTIQGQDVSQYFSIQRIGSRSA